MGKQAGTMVVVAAGLGLLCIPATSQAQINPDFNRSGYGIFGTNVVAIGSQTLANRNFGRLALPDYIQGFSGTGIGNSYSAAMENFNRPVVSPYTQLFGNRGISPSSTYFNVVRPEQEGTSTGNWAATYAEQILQGELRNQSQTGNGAYGGANSNLNNPLLDWATYHGQQIREEEEEKRIKAGGDTDSAFKYLDWADSYKQQQMLGELKKAQQDQLAKQTQKTSRLSQRLKELENQLQNGPRPGGAGAPSSRPPVCPATLQHSVTTRITILAQVGRASGATARIAPTIVRAERSTYGRLLTEALVLDPKSRMPRGYTPQFE